MSRSFRNGASGYSATSKHTKLASWVVKTVYTNLQFHTQLYTFWQTWEKNKVGHWKFISKADNIRKSLPKVENQIKVHIQKYYDLWTENYNIWVNKLGQINLYHHKKCIITWNSFMKWLNKSKSIIPTLTFPFYSLFFFLNWINEYMQHYTSHNLKDLLYNPKLKV